jgi:putative salt-induced outer membrane protein YdiY
MTFQRYLNHLKPIICLSVVLLISIFYISPLLADEVLMSNGDRITGEIVRQETGVLKLKTAYAGTLDIDWEHVDKVSLGEPSKVLLDDDTVLEVKGFTRSGDQLILFQVSSSPPLSIMTSRVKAIEPEPWELDEGYKISGIGNVAAKSQKGNSEKTEFDVDFMFRVRWRKNTWFSYGQFEYDTTRGIKSTDKWTLLNHYDHNFSGKWFAAGSLAIKHDRFADLKLRTIIGPGVGYRIFSSKQLNLRAEVAINYLKDDYYDQPDLRTWGPGWYIDYNQKFWKQRLQLYHRQTGFAAVHDSSKFLWRSWTGVRVPLKAGFVGSVEYEIDYDSKPADAAETTDQTFKIKLGYKW